MRRKISSKFRSGFEVESLIELVGQNGRCSIIPETSCFRL